MYLMYVDESGDSGNIDKNSPTNYFILSAIVVHELRWKQTLESLVELRKYLRDSKGLKLRDEIHSSEFINKPGELVRIKKNDRLDILKKCIDWLNSQNDISVFSIAIDKRDKNNKDIFDIAWKTLLTRFENTISHKNFNGPQNPDEKGIVLPDNTEGEKLTKLVRKMRHFNPVPNTKNYGDGYRNIKLEYLIEDPIFRDSKNSLIHQICDVIAYCIRQKFEPNSYMRKKGGHNFWKRLENVSVLVVSKSRNGIVEL